MQDTFEPGTESDGLDGPDGRGLRYLMWSYDPDPHDETYVTAFAFLLREADGRVTCEQDLHLEGLFRREDWLAWMREAGCPARTHRDAWSRDVIIGVKE